ncbi:unnamed protein product [Paramecium pentaurelia]|uniref:Uncharacterized protein n=1 Tax=Paramecium pentaurelia TaxID=43138 RepID=A0A8S1XIU3_9CILI|nr:unnamed protein product [Paramecium pentaurelia]
MGCSESAPFKSSLTLKTQSTIDTPSTFAQCVVPLSPSASFDNFDTYELDDQNISHYYDEIEQKVIAIPKLHPIDKSIIFQRRKKLFL